MRNKRKRRRNPKAGIDLRINTLKWWMIQQGIIKPEKKQHSVKIK